MDIDHAAVDFIAVAFCETFVNQAVNQRRDVRLGNAQTAGNFADRKRTVVIEQRKHLHMGERNMILPLNGV